LRGRGDRRFYALGGIGRRGRLCVNRGATRRVSEGCGRASGYRFRLRRFDFRRDWLEFGG
jgi:hypothetical protein